MAADRRFERQAALRAAIEEQGLDALLVTHIPNIRYLTGFSGSAALLVVRRGATILITDFRYAAQAPAEAGASASVEVDQSSVWERLGKVLASDPTAALGIEGQALTVRDAQRLSGLTRARVVTTSDLVERLRVVKSREEVAAIRAAAELAQDALAEVLPLVRPGRTEQDVAAALEAALRRRGSEWHPFPTIVASGPRSALPHARTSDRVVSAGEWLLLDFGAQLDGYCADLTRTVVVGARADDKQRVVYALVQAAQERAVSGLRAGMTGREADALAREVIAGRGFGESFGHSLGHGLGLEVHEAPRLGADRGGSAAGWRGGHGGAGCLSSGLGWSPVGGRCPPRSGWAGPAFRRQDGAARTVVIRLRLSIIMATTADFRNGLVLDIDGQLFQMVYFQHVKPGKGGAFVRTKLKNIRTGAVIDRTYNAGERVTDVRLERRPIQFSYSDGHFYHFMDQQTFDDIMITEELLGPDQLKYLKEGMECEGLVHDGTVILVDLPFFVELAVTRTDPGVRGDTATGATKPATLETGATVQVPLFIEEGQVIRVDRREDKYLTRV